MILIDLSHTSHTEARTGIQRVCRSLHQALPSEGRSRALAVTWDPFQSGWRALDAEEQRRLATDRPGAKRGATWSYRQRFRGWLRRGLPRLSPILPQGEGLMVPELFSPEVARSLPQLFRQVQGPRVALFHDAIALKRPALAPAKTVVRFPSYLRALLAFDGVAAVSEDSRDSLRDWWQWLGVTRTPELIALPLGIDAPRSDPALARATATPVVLSVGTLEPRKNHGALLAACEQLWQRGISFELRLIGLAPNPKANPTLAEIRRLQASGRPLRYDGPVDEPTLSAAYHECAFSVYPSLIEGFGLPVLESLSYGKPCICSGQGALGESSKGGGCLALPSVQTGDLAGALGALLLQPERRKALAEQAQRRPIRTWSDYTTSLVAWMRSLPLPRSS